MSFPSAEISLFYFKRSGCDPSVGFFQTLQLPHRYHCQSDTYPKVVSSSAGVYSNVWVCPLLVSASWYGFLVLSNFTDFTGCLALSRLPRMRRLDCNTIFTCLAQSLVPPLMQDAGQLCAVPPPYLTFTIIFTIYHFPPQVSLWVVCKIVFQKYLFKKHSFKVIKGFKLFLFIFESFKRSIQNLIYYQNKQAGVLQCSA